MRKNCNVCDLDVSAIKDLSHRGQCPICLRKTKHVLAVPGLPWVCTRAHENDETACVVCQVPLTEQNEGGFFLVTEDREKKICTKCIPSGGH